MDLATVWPILVVQIEAAVIAVDAVQKQDNRERKNVSSPCRERNHWVRVGSKVSCQRTSLSQKCHDTKIRAGSRAMMCYLTHLEALRHIATAQGSKSALGLPQQGVCVRELYVRSIPNYALETVDWVDALLA